MHCIDQLILISCFRCVLFIFPWGWREAEILILQGVWGRTKKNLQTCYRSPWPPCNAALIFTLLLTITHTNLCSFTSKNNQLYLSVKPSRHVGYISVKDRTGHIYRQQSWRSWNIRLPASRGGSRILATVGWFANFAWLAKSPNSLKTQRKSKSSIGRSHQRLSGESARVNVQCNRPNIICQSSAFYLSH